MLLKQIRLHNFRNFQNQDFTFNSLLTVIIGENARGKTNLLESIFFIANGVGFRESREEELINLDKKDADVEGEFDQEGNKFLSKIVLQKKDDKVAKAFFFNKLKKISTSYLKEQTKAVLFSPHQIEILTGSPSGRREYFNKIISFYDIEYKKRLANYERGIRRRNKLLEHSAPEEEFNFWNEYLVENGNYLTDKRQEYVDFLNKNNKIDRKTFKIIYLKNEISKTKLENYFDLEKRVRRTLIGPQKDDFQIFLMDKDLEKNTHSMASRSEQRLTILWLKLNEIKFHEELNRRKPILLLDDVFSELDSKNKKLALELIKNYQTIVTTYEKEVLDLIDGPKSIIRL